MARQQQFRAKRRQSNKNAIGGKLFLVSVTQHFDAAHYLRGYDGACANLHGHTWKVQVVFKCHKTNILGMAIDFKDIKKRLKNILDVFDHQCLNEIKPFDEQMNPTAEMLAYYIHDKLGDAEYVRVYESPDCYAEYHLK